MKGEEEFWYELASHLHLPVQRCKRETSSREFVRWRTYLSKKMTHHDKDDWRAANIVAAVRSAHSRKTIKLKDCLLDYGNNQPTAKTKQEAAAISKAKWFTLTEFKEQT